jgi:hypothetical protein
MSSAILRPMLGGIAGASAAKIASNWSGAISIIGGSMAKKWKCCFS